MKYSKQDREEALTRLREWIKPGDTVHTLLRHVSRSGMQREIGVVLLKDGIDLHPNHAVACVLGKRLGKRDGVIVGGCGMDMGFHLVYNLSYVLFPDGFGCVGDGSGYEGSGRACPSNDHSNGDRDYTPHGQTSSRCKACLDVPGKDGLGHRCKACDGTGMVKRDHQRWHKDGGYALRHRWL